MHKTFYASGFLYNPDSEQILLQHDNSSSPYWTLFGSTYIENDDPEIILKETIFSLFGVKTNEVFPVYSYTLEEKNIHQYIGYSIAKAKKNFPVKKGFDFAWFSFKEVLKLQVDPQIKHDIVVGQRVIDATLRKARGEHTFQ